VVTPARSWAAAASAIASSTASSSRRGEGGDRVEARVERQVHVGVDQPGQEGGVAEVEHLGLGGRGPVRTSLIRPSSTSTSGSVCVVTPSKRRAARRAVRVIPHVVRAF
jgi:hypothetical protein